MIDTPKPDPKPNSSSKPKPTNQLYGWALPGQVIIDPKVRGRMVYNRDSVGDGIADPLFSVGFGDPEHGLHNGQMPQILNKLKGHPGGAVYLHAVATHGGDAAYFQGSQGWNPFRKPTYPVQKYTGLDKLKMSKWRGWFTQLQKIGAIVYLFIYDDGSKAFGSRSKVTSDEKKFIQDFVMEFRRFPNIVFIIGEEYAEAISKPRANQLGNIIRASDPYRHVIGIHQTSGFGFNFPRNPHIKLFMIQQVKIGRAELHRKMVQVVRKAKGHFSNIGSEFTEPGLDTWGHGKVARLKSWAVFMSGASGILDYQRGRLDYPAKDVRDMDKLRLFAESIRELSYLNSNDRWKYGGTEYVLCNKPRGVYVLYTSKRKKYLGIKGIVKGTYDLNWYSCTTGRRVKKRVAIKGGNVGFKRPIPAWTEMALYLKKVA